MDSRIQSFMCDFMICICIYECVQVSLTYLFNLLSHLPSPLPPNYILLYTQVHTYRTPYKSHTLHPPPPPQFYFRIIGTSILEWLQRCHLWFPGTASLGIPVFMFLSVKIIKKSASFLFTQCLHHDALFCFLKLNQSILPQGTAVCVNFWFHHCQRACVRCN